MTTYRDRLTRCSFSGLDDVGQQHRSRHGAGATRHGGDPSGDLEHIRRVKQKDELAWLRAALEEHKGRGNPTL